MLTGLITGLVVGLIGAVVAVMRSSKAKARMQADLAARGFPVQPGGSALQIPTNRLMHGGNKPPEWSAAVPGRPALQIYGFGGVTVVAWWTAVQRPAAFVVTGPAGGNPDPSWLQEFPRKQLPVKEVKLFVNSPEAVPWILSCSILHTFAQRFHKQPGWCFVHSAGACYLFTYQGIWAGLDDAMQTAARFEQTLA
jgi:hypothetical protein